MKPRDNVPVTSVEETIETVPTRGLERDKECTQNQPLESFQAPLTGVRPDVQSSRPVDRGNTLAESGSVVFVDEPKYECGRGQVRTRTNHRTHRQAARSFGERFAARSLWQPILSSSERCSDTSTIIRQRRRGVGGAGNLGETWRGDDLTRSNRQTFPDNRFEAPSVNPELIHVATHRVARVQPVKFPFGGPSCSPSRHNPPFPR
ncbi:hypothetical protein WN55_10335 [Dufourea novaeangliae]|uniref:Uncharacterized protein n=1 Tax=Dufourea novaeangliae TaxID=178035 RepID=A0A154P3B2_DUFNO|nr:hypothetical protein WN55_10335 [Dufourea novaeangliae]